jgi:DNA topoisomerase-1
LENQALENYRAAEPAIPPSPEALQAAKVARLRYVNNRIPGISRERDDNGFVYRDQNGKQINDPDVLARIKSLAIPPAWTDVWICPTSNGHIQATGRDARGRKQYRYHDRWRAVRDENKFEHMLTFAKVLATIRRRVEKDLARPNLPREKVLAAVVRLMETTLARVGNPEYARENNSFGLTTLKNRHVRITGGKIELDFNAKHSIRHHSVVSDRKLARILKNCRDLPGSELFQYVEENGERHSITSNDVNDYLREISGEDITAKDFRTWAATNLAMIAFSALEEEQPSKKSQLEVIRQVAQQLGNTPAICRKCYIHPVVLNGYLAGNLRVGNLTISEAEENLPEVWGAERKVLRYLRKMLAEAEGQKSNGNGNGAAKKPRGRKS